MIMHNSKSPSKDITSKTTLSGLLTVLLSIAASNSYALDAPQNLSCNKTDSGATVWRWNSVANAELYDLIIDQQFVTQTNETEYLGAEIVSGVHTASIRSIDKNWQYSSKSDTLTCNLSGESERSLIPTDSTTLIDPQTLSQANLFNKDGYDLVFSDEFNGDRLSETRWNTQLRWDGSFNGEWYEYRTVNGEDQFYVNTYSQDQNHIDQIASVTNPFEFDGNRLAIRATRNPLQTHDGNKGYGPLQEMSTQKAFLSGVITTYDKFSQKYGYFEARIKIPSQVGTFPAFWLHHQRRESEGTQRTEIDIMENLGHAPWYVYNSFHYFTGVSEGVTGTAHSIKPQPEGQIYTGTDYSEDYHVYSVEWEPGYINYMIDGQTVSEVRDENAGHEELYLILNLAIGGNWTNYPSNAGGTGREEGNHFPTQNDINTWSNPALEIDYVRVFERK